MVPPLPPRLPPDLSRHACRPACASGLQGLVPLLVTLLDRGSPQLLTLAATFLRKLSLFADNSRALREAEVVGQLAALVAAVAPGAAGGGAGDSTSSGSSSSRGSGNSSSSSRSMLLLSSVLRLLHNLSFDDGMRQQMVAAGLIARLAGLLRLPCTGEPADASSNAGGGGNLGSHEEQGQGQGPPLRQLVLGLLYHLSLQDKHRSMFLYTGESAFGCSLVPLVRCYQHSVRHPHTWLHCLAQLCYWLETCVTRMRPGLPALQMPSPCCMPYCWRRHTPWTPPAPSCSPFWSAWLAACGWLKRWLGAAGWSSC